MSTSTTEPSPDCQQLVKRSEVGRQRKVNKEEERFRFSKIIFSSINKGGKRVVEW